MHPHDNPKYQQMLLNSFYTNYYLRTLNLKPERDEADFQKELARYSYKIYACEILSILGIVYYDKRYVSKVIGPGLSVKKFAYYSSAAIFSSLLFTLVPHTSRKIELGRQLSLKYERELMELDPQLRTFYLPIPESTDSPSVIHDNYQPYGSRKEEISRDWRGEHFAPDKDSSYPYSSDKPQGSRSR